MKSYCRIVVLILIYIILSLGTTGCWNSRELPNLAIVLGVGIDNVEDTDEVQVTAQVIKTAEMKSSSSEEGGPGGSGGGSSGAGAYWNVRNTGESMFAIFRDFTHKANRKLYFPHNEVLIFGRSLAEQGVQEHLDFFVRDQETRLGVFVLVAEEKASEIFNVQPKLEKVPSINIADLMEAQTATSQTSIIRLNQFINRLLSQTTAPIAPIIQIRGKGDDKELLVTGTAIFLKDKLVGQLNKEETRGLLWVIDEVKSGIIDVNCPDCECKVNLEIIRAQSKISSEIIEDTPYIKINIEEEGNIASQSCTANLVSPDAVTALEEEASEAIKDEIEAALVKSQKLNADIFGFGEAIHQKHPREWQEMKGNWDDIFPDLVVEIIVEAKLRRSGSLGRTVAPEKEQ